MERRLLLFLPLLSLVLMGGECEVGARVDTRPPEQREGTTATGGLVVGVQTGTSLEPVGVAASGVQREIVQAALAVPFRTPSIPEPVVTASTRSTPEWAGEPVRLAQVASVSEIVSPSSPVPEPGGILLFAAGLAVASGFMRRSFRIARDEARSALFRH